MAKSPEFPQLSETQLEIMNLIWSAGEATVGEVWKALARRRKVARNTVLTLMERLEKKAGYAGAPTDTSIPTRQPSDARQRSARSSGGWSRRRSTVRLKGW